MPTGELAPVAGTLLDLLTRPTPIGQRIKDIKAEPVGYDHNFVPRGRRRGKLRARGPRSVTPRAGG